MLTQTRKTLRSTLLLLALTALSLSRHQVVAFEEDSEPEHPESEKEDGFLRKIVKAYMYDDHTFMIVMAIIIFFIIAGGTGMDGGKPAKLAKLTPAEASHEGDPQVFLEIAISDQKVGRVYIQLFSSITPKTCENFRALCTGEKGKSDLSGKPLHFKGSIFHRIIPGFMCQGGDITNGNGTGGESIYGRNFDDEWGIIEQKPADGKGQAVKVGKMVAHTEPGLLSMANRGQNTNSSQFFLTTAKTSWLDGKHVVFGKVVKGMDIVKKMEDQGSQSGGTRAKVSITDCGEVKSKGT